MKRWYPPKVSLLACFTLLYLVAMNSNADIEIAPYEVLHKEGQFEVRQYGSLVLAKTSFAEQGNRNGAFRKLFRYISGDNDRSQKIAMTAPVFMEYSGDQMQSMAFVLPIDIPYESAPKPDSEVVEIERTKVVSMATIRFNGRLTEGNIEEHKRKLQSWITNNELIPIGAPQVAGYNSPWTLPFMRRNEVLIPIAPAAKG